MRKILISAAVAAVALSAAPGMAQSYYGDRQYGYGYGHGRDLRRQINDLEYRIRAAADRRVISRQEAFRLSREVNRIEYQYARYSRNGLSQWEYRELQNRIQQVRRQLRWDRRDRDWNDRRYYDDRYRDRDRDWGRDDDDDDDDDD